MSLKHVYEIKKVKAGILATQPCRYYMFFTQRNYHGSFEKESINARLTLQTYFVQFKCKTNIIYMVESISIWLKSGLGPNNK